MPDKGSSVFGIIIRKDDRQRSICTGGRTTQNDIWQPRPDVYPDYCGQLKHFWAGHWKNINLLIKLI